jgi:selenide,water dikinase
MNEIRLTQYSHGAGCGCKIAPDVLHTILKSNLAFPDDHKLIVGNHSKDDAAVYDIGHGQALIATTDFFMPIVDDPFSFGKIASANAISDIYAMGGKPILAIAILGWPIDKLGPEVAQRVIEGSRSICLEAGIALAGGHSIDAPEPIFGLAVNGIAQIENIKQNNKAQVGDLLLLTKPLGVGILTTAEKRGLLDDDLRDLATSQMIRLNKVGTSLGEIEGVHAMTDVTGFGLAGHLVEMCEGSGVSARIVHEKLPVINHKISAFIDQKVVPGGTIRNLRSYGHFLGFSAHVHEEALKPLVADPQTSGGLLISCAPQSYETVCQALLIHNLEAFTQPIGEIVSRGEKLIIFE